MRGELERTVRSIRKRCGRSILTLHYSQSYQPASSRSLLRAKRFTARLTVCNEHNGCRMEPLVAYLHTIQPIPAEASPTSATRRPGSVLTSQSWPTALWIYKNATGSAPGRKYPFTDHAASGHAGRRTAMLPSEWPYHDSSPDDTGTRKLTAQAFDPSLLLG